MAISRCKVAILSLLGICGVLVCLAGIVGYIKLPGIIKRKIHENLILAEGKETFEKWRNAPVPIYFRIYVFNVTNPDEILSKGEKPKLQEVGPYVFRQKRKKEIKDWGDGTVRYRDVKSFYFDEDLSVGTQNENVTTLNIPIVVLSAIVDKRVSGFWRGFVETTAGSIFTGYRETLFKKIQVKNLLFEGYEVQFLADIINALKLIKDNVPEVMPNNTFGLLYGKNNSGDGEFVVHTGAHGMSKYATIKTWNNMSSLPWWNDEFCNMINGSDGSQYPPPVTKNSRLFVFTADLCRSVRLIFDRETSINKIPALRFVTPNELFAKPSVNPDNKCFCSEGGAVCETAGILRLSACRKGAPIVVSQPHFFQGDPSLSDAVIGLHPDESIHKNFADIEPSTGVVLNAARMIQINVHLKKYINIPQLANVPDLIFPIVWLKETAQITPELSEKFIAKVKTPVKIGKALLITAIAVGCVLVFITACITLYLASKYKQQKKIPPPMHYTAVETKVQEDIKKTPLPPPAEKPPLAEEEKVNNTKC